MKTYWTLEKLSALPADRLEVVRQNAQKAEQLDLVELCESIQLSRRPRRGNPIPTADDPVIGFHFVCQDDYEVTPAENGQFWSGVWAISEALCDPAISMKGYLALHTAKHNKSYRQGFIVAWKRDQRTKGKRQMGVSFLVQPFEQDLEWVGGGAGEKGYRRLSHQPKWPPAP